MDYFIVEEFNRFWYLFSDCPSSSRVSVARRMREGDKRPKKHIWREVKENLTQEPDKTQVRPE